MSYFAENAHEMHLISFAETSEDEEAELDRLGIKYHGSTGNFHIKKPWLTLRDLRFVRSVLKREKIDILHSHFLGANAWFAAVSGFHPHILTIMGGGDVTGPDWKPDGNFQSRYLTPYTLRNADQITSWSKLMADVVRPFSAETPIDVIHGGIQLERFGVGERPKKLLERYGIPADGKVIFSPRLMRPLSNIDQIALSANIIAERDADTYFLVAYPTAETDQAYCKKVRSIFEEGRASERVRYIQGVPHDEMADHFRLADITVSIPSTDGTPMTVLESMACGTPTVIGDLPDYDAEYFEDEKTTLMVDVKDPGSIASAIIRLLTDQELAERISNEARRRVEETGSYEFQMSKMEAIYQSLIKK